MDLEKPGWQAHSIQRWLEARQGVSCDQPWFGLWKILSSEDREAATQNWWLNQTLEPSTLILAEDYFDFYQVLIIKNERKKKTNNP